jgi:hypothetical protein
MVTIKPSIAMNYANGTVICHKMPMNMTMPVSEEK